MTEAKAIALAAELYGRGRYGQAVRVCQQILQHNPKVADAHNILGVSLSALGKTKDGIAALKRAVKLGPQTSSYSANLGEILRSAGNVAEAVVYLTNALKYDARNAQAHNNLGIIYYERGDYERAVESYRAALNLAPKMPEAWNNLGNSLRLIGDLEGALSAYEQALSLRDVYPEAYNNLGTLLREQDKADQAEHALRKAIAQNPRYVDAYNNLAAVYHAEGQDVEALRQLSEALKLEPKNAKTLCLVGRVQLKRGSHDLAEQACRMVLADDSGNVEALTVLAQIKHETDQYDEAVRLMEAAVQADPKNAEAANFLGVALKSVGRLDEARDQILHAIDINDKLFGAYANLNDLITFQADHPLVEKMERYLKEEDVNPARVLPLHYAYAKALDDTGRQELALSHYIEGGVIKRRQLNYVEAETFDFFNRIIGTFSSDFIKSAVFAGLQTERPVFIIGMPRSGSTLVEQILSSHPEVFGAGEVKYFSQSLHVLRDRFPSLSRFPELVSELNEGKFKILADQYDALIAKGSGNKLRVTDKLLTNYFFVGLIHIIYPNAKIINTQRNPIDNCLSAFTKLFKDDMPHSYDLGELGRYYKKYEELMDHWRSVIPSDRLKTVYYENVVNDTERLARDLVDFIGLTWDESCLNFYKSSRPVKTASVAQVRKPIYKDSIDRWKRYGPKLQPLLEALGYRPDGTRP